MLKKQLLEHLRAQFALDWKGIHGAPHWARVRHNGLLIAKLTGADREVIELFALLHDARRVHDGNDSGHGIRSAELAEQLNGQFYQLETRRLGWLLKACEGHSEGYLSSNSTGLANRTITACWDADRLDLGRIGVRPDMHRLCNTDVIDRGFIEAALQRSHVVWRG